MQLAGHHTANGREVIYSRFPHMTMFKFTSSSASAIAALGALFLSGCAPLPHDPNEKYIQVTTNIKVHYWQTALQGLSRAASELKVKAELDVQDNYDTKAEHD
jgi:ABC-type sugar transport system substrate-binding protein